MLSPNPAITIPINSTPTHATAGYYMANTLFRGTRFRNSEVRAMNLTRIQFAASTVRPEGGAATSYACMRRVKKTYMATGCIVRRDYSFLEPTPLSLYPTLSTCSTRTTSSASSPPSPFRWMLTFFLPRVVSHVQANLSFYCFPWH